MTYQQLKVIEQQVSVMGPDTISQREMEVSLFRIILFIAVTPAPSSYNLRSEFSPTPGTKAFSFGIAREAYEKVYIKE